MSRQSRQRAIAKWKRWYRIEVCVPPKVRIICSYRNHGLSVQFGKYFNRYLDANGIKWTEEGTPTEIAKKYYAGFSGWMDGTQDWKHLWRYIRTCYVDGAISDMDLR